MDNQNIKTVVRDLSRGARFVSPDGTYQLDCANVNRSIAKAYRVARLTNLTSGQVMNDAWDSGGDMDRVAELVDRLCHWSGYKLVGFITGYHVSCGKHCGFDRRVAYMEETIPAKCPTPKCEGKIIKEEVFEQI